MATRPDHAFAIFGFNLLLVSPALHSHRKKIRGEFKALHSSSLTSGHSTGYILGWAALPSMMRESQRVRHCYTEGRREEGPTSC
jgi:hypothetical protein